MTRKLSSLRSELSDALEGDHYNCSDNCCDISAAMNEGLYLWAAHLLTGATECEATERAYARYQRAQRPAAFQRALEAERVALCALPHQECRSCNSIVWNGEDETCGNCLARLPRVFWRVKFLSYSGMSWTVSESEPAVIPGEDTDDKRDARQECISLLRLRVKRGHPVKLTISRNESVTRQEFHNPKSFLYRMRGYT